MTELAKLKPAPPAVQPSNDGAVILTMIDKLLARPDVPVEKLEQMFALHQKVQAEAARRAYLYAFSKLQADLPAVARKGKGHNDKRYARFEDVIEALREPLCRHGFSLSFRTQQEPGTIRVTGVLGHEAGHQETTDILLPADKSGSKNDVQSWGSSISYGKRYVSLTLTGIATEDDDDGQKAQGVINDVQRDELTKLITETKTDIGKFLEIGGVESLSDIPAAQFEGAKAKLLAKKAQMMKATKP